MMKKISAILIICSISAMSFAQNLVVNPSFESVNSGSLLCSWYVSQAEFNSAINNWTNPTGGSSDIFHTSLATTCFCSPFSTHASSPGTQAPRTGNSMSALFVYGNGGCSPYREYLQGQLSSPLVPGQQYCVEFYVSMADKCQYACNNIGVYFTTANVNVASMCVYSATPQVNYTGIITDKTNWTLISLTFTPTAAYTRFMIGNFYNDAGTSTTNVGGTVAQTRYFIDDVSVSLCSPNPVVTVNNPVICSGQSATINASSSIAGTTFNWSTGASGNSITVSPTSTTTYTVTGTAPSGNTGTALATVTVNPVPVLNINASPINICPGSSSSLSVTSNIPGSTFSWSSGQSGSPISVSPTSNTTYIVTGTSPSSCSASASVTVGVNAVPTITVTNPSVCNGVAANIVASGGANYNWSTGASGNSITVNPSTTTTYTVTGTNVLGCTGTSLSTVTVENNPTVSLSASSNPICAGSTAVISASGTTNYNWSTGASGSSISVAPMSNTTYSVTGTSTGGCTGTSSITISVSALPVITTTGDVICMGETASIGASGASSYSWSDGSAGSLIMVSPTTNTSYTVTGTGTNGCSATATAQVDVNPLPIIIVNDATICNGMVADLTASGANTYNWSNGNSGSSIQVTPSTTSTYSVTGTDANSCSASSSATVTVSPSPILSLSATADYCAGSNGTAGVVASGASNPYTYIWSTIPIQTNPDVSNLSAGIYYVTVTDSNGCSSSASVTVPSEPGFSITADTEVEHCLQNDGLINLTAINNTLPLTYIWAHDNMLNNPSASGLSSGNYLVTITDGLCSQSMQINVGSYDGPDAGFIAQPSNLSVDDGPVQITDASSGAISWFYDFGEGGYSIESDPSYSYAVPGNYQIMQIVTDEFGCLDTAYNEVIVVESYAIYIPNAFSPNGDGLNDYFRPSGIGIDPDNFQMWIYDRWGNLMFQTSNINSYWDGNVQGKSYKDINQDVYSYRIILKSTAGKDFEYYGHVVKLP